jgi:hypothetical protein
MGDGALLDGRGWLKARLPGRGAESRGAEVASSADAAMWEALVEIFDRAWFFSPPLFDSHGNAWVFLSDGVALRVVRSNGRDGTWQPPATLIEEANEIFGLEATIDPQDRITLVFRGLGVQPYELLTMRYTPGSGWSEPQVVFSSTQFFQAIEVAADAQGNVVVVFDLNEPLFNPGLWTLVFDASAGTWGEASRITAANTEAYVPTVVRNRSGNAIALIYILFDTAGHGLYAHRLDSSTKAWGPARFLPGSRPAIFSLATPASRYPATVDDDGNVAVFWATRRNAVYASRQQEGAWQLAHRLLLGGPYLVDLENFADAETSELGTTWGALTRFEGDANRLYVFRYLSSAGWQAAENPYTYSPNLSTTRARIAPYRGDRAVATFYADQDGEGQITSLLYDGTSWASNLLDIPGDFFAFFQETATDDGEVLLVFEPGTYEGEVPGIAATWLRDATEP